MNALNTLRSTRRAFLAVSFAVALSQTVGCGGGGNNVANEQNARRAYFGLDLAVDKAINLGMAGYNAASNANIPPQTGTGGTSGTLTISGHVDAGVSNNKTMNLTTAMANYADPVPTENDASVLHIVYDTSTTLPALSLNLNNIPNGTFTGHWTGDVTMSGDLEGTVTLALDFSGAIRAVSGSTTQIERTPGGTHITGTVTSQYGTYTVDITR